jgi:hypothetical protein
VQGPQPTLYTEHKLCKNTVGQEPYIILWRMTFKYCGLCLAHTENVKAKNTAPGHYVVHHDQYPVTMDFMVPSPQSKTSLDTIVIVELTFQLSIQKFPNSPCFT